MANAFPNSYFLHIYSSRSRHIILGTRVCTRNIEFDFKYNRFIIISFYYFLWWLNEQIRYAIININLLFPIIKAQTVIFRFYRPEQTDSMDIEKWQSCLCVESVLSLLAWKCFNWPSKIIIILEYNFCEVEKLLELNGREIHCNQQTENAPPKKNLTRKLKLRKNHNGCH